MAFTCYVHDFSTDDIEEWDQHNQDKEHTVTGIAPCNLCGIVTDFELQVNEKYLAFHVYARVVRRDSNERRYTK